MVERAQQVGSVREHLRRAAELRRGRGVGRATEPVRTVGAEMEDRSLQRRDGRFMPIALNTWKTMRR